MVWAGCKMGARGARGNLPPSPGVDSVDQNPLQLPSFPDPLELRMSDGFHTLDYSLGARKVPVLSWHGQLLEERLEGRLYNNCMNYIQHTV